MKIKFICLLSLFFTQTVVAQQAPKVLVVTAHPDDETGVAALVYKVTHELNGTVDQCVITNGEGGYKYSTLGNTYYGLELTDEKIGREHLPRIRKQELMNAGKIIGTRNIYFLDQTDAHYGLDEKEPLDTTWNVGWVTTRLKDILTKTKYDFLICMLPVAETHAHHKAATLLSLRTVQTLPDSQRPIVLGYGVSSKTDTTQQKFTQLKNYTETKTVSDTALFTLDRTASFGYKNKLNYKMVVNWEIAEHKSQGTMQLAINQGDFEKYWLFALNPPSAKTTCEKLFEQLRKVPYPELKY
ncbi:MAG: PIG-L family deacetylase [Chitinophagales bacterium]|nr:PIG-L family deacetylase [Chitinophagales bacterium]